MPKIEPNGLDELYRSLQDSENHSESDRDQSPNDLDLDFGEDSSGSGGESEGGYSGEDDFEDAQSSKKLKDLERGYQAKYRELAELRKELRAEIEELRAIKEDIGRTKSPADSDEVDIDDLIGESIDPDKKLSKLEKELKEVREYAARSEARTIIQNAADATNKKFNLNLTPDQYGILIDKLGIVPKNVPEAVRLIEIAGKIYSTRKNQRLGEPTLPESGPAMGSGAAKDLAPKAGESFKDFYRRLPE